MRFVVLDFETYWNSKDKYSLSKMGPIEYIRDPRFFVQCVGFRINRGDTHVIPYMNSMDAAALKALHLEAPDTITIGHNLNGFDALVLSEHYGIHPYMMVDTISMMNWLGLSRIMSCSHKTLTAALGHGIKQAGTVVSDGKRTREEFTEDDWKFFMQYCADDVTQCSENFFTLLPYIRNMDALKLMSITAKMGTEPAFIPDEQMLRDYVQDLDNAAEETRQKLASFLHFETVEEMLKAIRSRKKFPALLESLGCKCPTKISATTGKPTYATAKSDLAFTKLLEHENPQVRALVAAKLEHTSTIQKSRSNSLLTFNGKPLPILLAVYKAHTGRYAAGNEGQSDGLNFQNLSKRDPTKLAIREAIKVPAGYKVVACDSSQVEARILAWVSGQNDLVEQFRDGRDPYAEMASKIFGQSAKEIHDGAKQNDHPQHDLLKRERNVGKTCILSCLSADTEVLTDMGWKPILYVTLADKLWDGEQWVNHSGLSYNGMKKTIELDGLRLTADHLIWNGTTWNAANRFIEQPKSLTLAIQYAIEQLPMYALSINQTVNMQNSYLDATNVAMSNGTTHTELYSYQQTVAQIVRKVMQTVCPGSKDSIPTMKLVQKLENLLCWIMQYAQHALETVSQELNESLKCNAAVELNPIGYYSPIYTAERLHDATHAQRRKLMPHAIKNITLCETSCQTTKQDADLWDESIRAMNAATVKHIDCTNTMEHAVSRLSSKISMNLCNILPHYLDMTTLTKHLTASIIMETMQKVISDLLPSLTKPVINVQSMICSRSSTCCVSKLQTSKQSSPSTKVEPVYDLLNAGPNHRFTVRTNHGALLVHNCGYGVSAKKFSDTLMRSGIKLADDPRTHELLASQAHGVYRDVSNKITAFWKQADRVIRFLCTVELNKEYGRFGAHNEFSFGRANIPGLSYSCAYIELPNTYRIWYPNLRIHDGQAVYDRLKHGKVVPARTYGASVVENICQSYAFMMLGWQACRMADAGISLKANIHDAWITVVPEAQAEATKQTMEQIMNTVPSWLEGFPVGCEAEIGDDFRIA